jgi:hypothetical protein
MSSYLYVMFYQKRQLINIMFVTILFLLVLFSIPSSITLLPSLVIYYWIRKRSSSISKKNLHFSLFNVKLSFVLSFLANSFLIYKFILGPDETSTPGFVLVIMSLMVICLPLIITVPISLVAYLKSSNEYYTGKVE